MSNLKKCCASIIFGVLGLAILIIVPLAYPLISARLLGNASLGLDVMKAVFSWPVSVLILSLAILSIFKNEIRNKLIELKQVGRNGALFGQDGSQTDLPDVATGKDPRKGEISWEEWSLNVISKFNPDDRQIILHLGQQQQDVIHFWVRQWWFEKVWGQIYGTQVELLETIATKEKQSTKDIVPFFIEHIERLSKSTLSFKEEIKDHSKLPAYFEGYVHFLKSANLITGNGSEIEKTELTEQFLEYIKRQGYSKYSRIL